jgi:hypothetical protein
VTASRRGFIRVVGSGAAIVAAGSMGLAGCDSMPDAAIAAWQGPSPDMRDPRLRALSYAILAPNPHNMQAWLVDLRVPDRVILHVDRTRLLPMTDPYSRQVMIGQGTFLELLAIAAAEQGYRADVALFPEGEYPTRETSDAPIAQVVFRRDPAIRPDPLFAQILRRHTTRSEYEPHPLEPAHSAQLRALSGSPDVGYTLIETEPVLSGVRAIAADAFSDEMTNLRTLKETVDRSRIGAVDIAAHRDGLSFHGTFFWWAHALGIMTPQAMLTPGSIAFKTTIDTGRRWAMSTAAFGVLTTAGNSRVAQIAAGRAYVRAHLLATALGIVQAPVSQVLEEYPEVAEAQARLYKLLGTPPGHTIQMLYRMGYGEMGEAAPRRPLRDLLLA